MLTPTEKASRLAYNLKNAFCAKYGAAFDAGMLGATLLDDLVRGLAFTVLAAQDESTSLNDLLPHVEAAVEIVLNTLRAA